MEYKVLNTIVNSMVERFLSQYRSTTKLFENDGVKNGLLHAGEYGTYKENLCKELFKFVLPGKYDIGTGFVFNAEREITTQCDIILYDYNNTPCISLDQMNRFYPQESILAIGEIKSTLTKQTLADSLIKLSQSKSIRKDFTGISSTGSLVDVKLSQSAYHHIFTFLICDEISSYDSQDVVSYIDDQYEQASVSVENRHNVIVSFKNGLITYKSNADMEGKLGITNRLFVPFSYYNSKGILEKLDPYIFCGDEVSIVKQFIIHINNFLKNADSYYPDPVSYII